MNFMSDTAAPAHPAILEAMVAAATGPAPSYGNDPWTKAARDTLCKVFETDLDIWLVSSGTAANALGLSILCPSHGGVLCHQDAHIQTDERGAPEFYTGGGKLILLPGKHARIDLAALKTRLDFNDPDFVHETPVHALSLSNLTENGAAYRPFEIQERAALAREACLAVHLDGARLANALVSTGASPAEMTWRAGVDVLSFGATKNGAVGCEAIILFGAARKRLQELQIRAKRAGHMPPKMRFLGAQMSAYLKDGLWLDLARRANMSATTLAAALTSAGAKLTHPVDGNEVFAHLPPGAAERLQAAGAGFYPWPDGSHRFVTSWATEPEEIEAFAAALES
ncbi:MAG TPA: beta-eliminating lyase-related protein [Hyphomonadaceae bacterium]|nr:beta-eliminating lyase-related protein [Hyphomonadaceae bacterium]